MRVSINRICRSCSCGNAKKMLGDYSSNAADSDVIFVSGTAFWRTSAELAQWANAGTSLWLAPIG